MCGVALVRMETHNLTLSFYAKWPCLFRANNIYHWRALNENALSSSVKEKLSDRSPGRALPMQIRQTQPLGLAYNICRLWRPLDPKEDLNRARALFPQPVGCLLSSCSSQNGSSSRWG